jgi:predicted DsbA family dithiol-disulfide isomerase
MNMYMAAMEDLGKAENIKFDLRGGMVANTLHAHRILQYLQNNKEQGIQLKALKSLYWQYFEQRAHPSSNETLVKACVAAGMAKDEAEKLVEDSDEELRQTKAAIQEQAGNGVDSVPYVIFEGRKRDFTLVGAKSVAEYEKVLGQVAKECT